MTASGSFLAGQGRLLLEQRLALAVDGAEWERAAILCSALLDCWPLAAAVEDARQRWEEHRPASALAVLTRAAEVTRLALGQPEEAEPEVLPSGVRELPIEDLVAQRGGLACALARGELRAVLVRGPVPDDPTVQLALGELRLEGSHQRALERFGLPGLELDPREAWDPPGWQGVLVESSPGRPGPVLVSRCHGRFLPGPLGSLAAGLPQRVGYLLWESPVRPVAVAPVAVAVLRALDGQRDSAAVAELLGGPPDQVQLVLDELVALGAASAVA